MGFLEFIKFIESNSSRPMLAIKIVFACIDARRNGGEFLSKTSLDESLFDDENKRKVLSKNSSAVISELFKLGVLNKFSVVDGECVSFRGQPFPLVISLDDEIIKMVS